MFSITFFSYYLYVIMYPDLYIRICIIELYSIVFHFPSILYTDNDFTIKQNQLIQTISMLLHTKSYDMYTRQSRKKFHLINNTITPDTPIRLFYIEHIIWNNKRVTGMHISLCTSFIQDHHYSQLLLVQQQDKNEWLHIIDKHMNEFIKEIVI